MSRDGKWEEGRCSWTFEGAGESAFGRIWKDVES